MSWIVSSPSTLPFSYVGSPSPELQNETLFENKVTADVIS